MDDLYVRNLMYLATAEKQAASELNEYPKFKKGIVPAC
jgi:hypothetical protein